MATLNLELAGLTLVDEAAHEQQFPKFLQLPTELQLMIWAAWREDQPAIRHYFCLESDGRGYAAFDPTTKRCVKTTARTAISNEDDPLDPMEYKIRFTTAVAVVPEGSTISINKILDGHTLSTQPRMNPAFAWVNFEKDVFIIENTSHRFPGNMRFLLRNVGAKMPPPLEPGHWASRIQTLAFRITGPTLRDVFKLAQCDVWSKMTLLKTVLLIINDLVISLRRRNV
jgi:hypothetical protein